jgi:hypothetical protein
MDTDNLSEYCSYYSYIDDWENIIVTKQCFTNHYNLMLSLINDYKSLIEYKNSVVYKNARNFKRSIKYVNNNIFPVDNTRFNYLVNINTSIVDIENFFDIEKLIFYFKNEIKDIQTYLDTIFLEDFNNVNIS